MNDFTADFVSGMLLFGRGGASLARRLSCYASFRRRIFDSGRIITILESDPRAAHILADCREAGRAGAAAADRRRCWYAYSRVMLRAGIYE